MISDTSSIMMKVESLNTGVNGESRSIGQVTKRMLVCYKLYCTSPNRTVYCLKLGCLPHMRSTIHTTATSISASSYLFERGEKQQHRLGTGHSSSVLEVEEIMTTTRLPIKGVITKVAVLRKPKTLLNQHSEANMNIFPNKQQSRSTQRKQYPGS